MIKKILLLFIIISIFSCNSTNNCNFPSYNKERINKVSLSAVGERSLNTLSQNYSLLADNQFTKDNYRRWVQIRFYFEILPEIEESKIVIEEIISNYNDSNSNYSFTTYSIPLSEVDVKNIGITSDAFTNIYQNNTTSFYIESKYRNPTIDMKFVSYDKGTKNIKQCEKWDGISIEFLTEDAVKIEKAFKNFITEYKNTAGNTAYSQ